MSQKSYNNTASLYLIPTPIGNLDDITIRAINTLKMVEIIFCEDTRVTRNLLDHYNIKKKLISNHKFNEDKNKVKLIDLLKNGKNVGLVSDRGTPAISDPGFRLTQFAIEYGYNVIALPGPTALIPALVTSGIKTESFIFCGFLDSREAKRKKELTKLKNIDTAIIIYEAPHRLEKTLNDILEILGNKKVGISREISKKYEEVYRGTILDVKEEVKNVKGEIVVVIEGSNSIEEDNNLTVSEHVDKFVQLGYKKMDAIKEVSKMRGVNKNEIYNMYLKRRWFYETNNWSW